MLMMGRLVSIRDPVLARVEYRKLTLHVSDYTTTHVSVQPWTLFRSDQLAVALSKKRNPTNQSTSRQSNNGGWPDSVRKKPIMNLQILEKSPRQANGRTLSTHPV